MTLNSYFMSNSVLVPAVLLRAFDFQKTATKNEWR